jgi:REP element-mobilizing transposase RayT
MVERPLSLDEPQRSIVHRVIRDHCRLREWQLHAVDCRTQHVHIALTAPQASPAECMSQLKAWTTRRLAEAAPDAGRKKWWTENGSRRLIFDESDLVDVVAYITECQDKPRE